MARAFQTILKEFNGNKKSAYKLEKITSKGIYCNAYFRNKNSFFVLLKYIFHLTVNNRKRKEKFNEYDSKLMEDYSRYQKQVLINIIAILMYLK